jgi:hypothetical protein
LELDLAARIYTKLSYRLEILQRNKNPRLIWFEKRDHNCGMPKSDECEKFEISKFCAPVEVGN